MDWDQKEDGSALNTWKGSNVERYLNSVEAEFSYYNSYSCTSDKTQLTKEEGFLHKLRNNVQMIADATWNDDNITLDKNKKAKDYIELEKSDTTLYSGKVGLSYISDYAYSVINRHWLLTVYNYDNGIEGWLPEEILKISSIINLNKYGTAYDVACDRSAVKNGEDIYPTFYLNEKAKYKGGAGTKANPIIVGL